MKPWLVVEDEEDIRNIVKVMFTAWGHTSLDFRDGNQTFAWLDKVEAGTFQGELPDLALLDIKMPGPRGNEIARRMRSFEAFKTIPIVLMTAFTLEDQERQLMVRDDGVDYIIDKPLPDFFELKKLLDEICEKKKARVGAGQVKAGGDSAKPPVSEPVSAEPVKPVVEPATPAVESAKSTAEPASESKVVDSGVKTAKD